MNNMLKYLIIDELLKQKLTSDELAKKLHKDVETIRVVLTRMKARNEVDFEGSIRGNIFFLPQNASNNQIQISDDKYKSAFEELFKFFMDIMQNVDNVIKDVDKWNEIWDKRQKDIVYSLGKEMVK